MYVPVRALGQSSVEVQLNAQLEQDLNRRLTEGDWDMSKQQFKDFAKGAGTIAGVAACTAAGMPALGMACGAVGAMITDFLVGTVWGAFDGFFGSSDAEEEMYRQLAEAKKIQDAITVEKVIVAAIVARTQAVNKLMVMASDLGLTKLKYVWFSSAKNATRNPPDPAGRGYAKNPGGVLGQGDIEAQLYREGLPKTRGDEWRKKFKSGEWTAATVIQAGEQYLDKLIVSSTKTASKLIAMATVRKTFEKKLQAEKTAKQKEAEAAAKAREREQLLAEAAQQSARLLAESQVKSTTRNLMWASIAVVVLGGAGLAVWKLKSKR